MVRFKLGALIIKTNAPVTLIIAVEVRRDYNMGPYIVQTSGRQTITKPSTKPSHWKAYWQRVNQILGGGVFNLGTIESKDLVNKVSGK